MSALVTRWIKENLPRARAEPKELRGAARRPPRRFARYASLTAGAGAWRRRCAKTARVTSHPALGVSVFFLASPQKKKYRGPQIGSSRD